VFQELSLLLAQRENARIVLATDPDADRLAVAEKSEGCVCLKALQSTDSVRLPAFTGVGDVFTRV